MMFLVSKDGENRLKLLGEDPESREMVYFVLNNSDVFRVAETLRGSSQSRVLEAIKILLSFNLGLPTEAVYLDQDPDATETKTPVKVSFWARLVALVNSFFFGRVERVKPRTLPRKYLVAGRGNVPDQRVWAKVQHAVIADSFNLERLQLIKNLLAKKQIKPNKVEHYEKIVADLEQKYGAK